MSNQILIDSILHKIINNNNVDLYELILDILNQNIPDIKYIPDYYSVKFSQDFINKELSHINYDKTLHKMYGKIHPSTVKYAWYTDTGLDYIFGKTLLHPLKARSFKDVPMVRQVRDEIEKYTGYVFNSVLINRYEDGTTKLSCHHDNDPWLGDNFIVPSLSFGAKRKFEIKHSTTLW